MRKGSNAIVRNKLPLLSDPLLLFPRISDPHRVPITTNVTFLLDDFQSASDMLSNRSDNSVMYDGDKLLPVVVEDDVLDWDGGGYIILPFDKILKFL